MLQHAHPTKFVAEILGIMWSAYLLWNHHWILALVIGMSFFLLSTILLWGDRFQNLAETHLGRVLLVYSSPLGFAFYNVSVVPLVYGLWIHSGFYINLGVSIILLPHLWSWKRSSSQRLS